MPYAAPCFRGYAPIFAIDVMLTPATRYYAAAAIICRQLLLIDTITLDVFADTPLCRRFDYADIYSHLRHTATR